MKEKEREKEIFSILKYFIKVNLLNRFQNKTTSYMNARKFLQK